MAVRTAAAEWRGALQDGNGTMHFDGYDGPYTFKSRFGEGQGTNPEELLGAAHAGCFSMALSGELNQAGYVPESIRTTARVHIDPSESGFTITTIDLQTEARVPGISEDDFRRIADGAKKGCPVSRALTGVTINLQAKLA